MAGPGLLKMYFPIENLDIPTIAMLVHQKGNWSCFNPTYTWIPHDPREIRCFFFSSSHLDLANWRSKDLRLRAKGTEQVDQWIGGES